MHRNFVAKKMQEFIVPIESEHMLIIDTLKKGSKISKIFSYENNTLFLNILYPLIQEKKIHGVIYVRGLLTQDNNKSAITSFNLLNLFLIIIFFMFLISIIFTRSIIRPIRVLSYITKAEQSKFNTSINELDYPLRKDEIGGLSNDIRNMSKVLKSQINENN